MLTWTTEPPTEPGWYFVRTSRVFVVHVQRSTDDRLEVWTGAIRQSVWFYVNRLHAEFAGPITEPEEKQDEMDK